MELEVYTSNLSQGFFQQHDRTLFFDEAGPSKVIQTQEVGFARKCFEAQSQTDLYQETLGKSFQKDIILKTALKGDFCNLKFKVKEVTEIKSESLWAGDC